MHSKSGIGYIYFCFIHLCVVLILVSYGESDITTSLLVEVNEFRLFCRSINFREGETEHNCSFIIKQITNFLKL